MSEENSTLDFDFDNTSDVVLPPSPGIREVRFDEAPKIEPNRKDSGKTNFVARMKICDNLVESEVNRILMCFYDTKDQKTEIKRVFLACGIKPFAGIPLSELIGKTCKVNVTHSNVTDKITGITKVYANIQEFIVPAEMITNVPKTAQVGTSASKAPVPA